MTQEEKKEKARLKSRLWYEKNKEKKKKYQNDNKDKIKENKKEYWKNNKEKLQETKQKYEDKTGFSKKYYTSNKEKLKIYKKEYYKNNKEKLKEYSKNRHKEQLIKNPIFKLKKNIRTLIGDAFRRNKHKKTSKTIEILGCSFEEFKHYIESKFESWMTWDNKGLYNGDLNYGWDFDHIIPISSASTIEEILKLSHYTNFQPMCSYKNRFIKRNK